MAAILWGRGLGTAFQEPGVAVNADFIQSVARVGSYVEVALITGDRFEGVLAELALDRLTLTRADGFPVAVALSTIATVMQKTPPAPGRPAQPLAGLPLQGGVPRSAPPVVVPVQPGTAAQQAVPPPQQPVAQQDPARAQSPDPAPAPAPSTPAAPSPAAPAPAARTQPEPDPEKQAAALARVAELPTVPVDLGVYVIPDLRKQLDQIRSSYAHAEKVKELEPRFPRVGQLYQRTVYLWNGDRTNPELTRLVGAFALLKGDTESAHRYLLQASDASDVPALRLLAVSAARQEDPDTALYALLRYFHVVTPGEDEDTWAALLALLDAGGGRARLGELMESDDHDEAGRAAVRAALRGVTPERTPRPRPPGAVAKPVTRPVVPQVQRAPVPAVRKNGGTSAPAAKRTSAGGRPRGFEDPYQRAKYLEHRVKDLAGAKAALREAIKKGIKRESAAKDLAWLTRRTDGPEAALEVIEHECAGIIPEGDTLDNILIDFLTGARHYERALLLLDRQYRREDLSSSKRYHLCHQIAYVKLAHGQDSTQEWSTLLDQSPDNPAAQRGLALALIQRGTPEDLDRAEDMLRHNNADAKANAILQQIAVLRQGGGQDLESADWAERLLQPSDRPLLADLTPPLVTHVMQNYSEMATRAKEEKERENKQLHTRDLNQIADIARQMSGKQPENSARAYISAAVLARELGERDAEQRYLYLGLTSLADTVLDRQESARDLYCAALTAADDRDDEGSDGGPDIRSALIGYFRSLSGKRSASSKRRDRDESSPLTGEVARVLMEEYRTHGPEVFNLIPPLLADTALARDVVLDAINSRADLSGIVGTHLGISVKDAGGERNRPDPQAVRAAWQQAGDQWSRDRRQLKYSLSEVQNLTAVAEDVLDSALRRLQDPQLAHGPLSENLGRIKEALSELRRYINEQSFEERESCLRLAGQAVRGLRAEIGRGPTRLSIELVEPVAVRIEELVTETRRQLIAARPPQPELSLALEQSSGGQNGEVTVQIKVANAVGRAPLESPELEINADPDLFTVAEPNIPLPTAVRGGDYRIEAVRLRVTEEALRAGAFSLPVTLRYRTRSSDDFMDYDANLVFRLARGEEFQTIVNKFKIGATGVPVKDPDMFVGRDPLIEKIRSRLRDAKSPGVGVAIFGQKRAGKSSIRLHLKQRLEKDDKLPVVDVGNIGDFSLEAGNMTGTRMLALLMWRILEGAEEALDGVGLCDPRAPLIPAGLTREVFLESEDPIYDCAKIINAHRRGAPVPPPPLIVMIDEFQYIDRWIRMELLPASFMQVFKAVIERGLFHLVIVGQAALDRLIQEDPNIFGVFDTQRVTYLDEADARLLVERPIYMTENDPATTRYKERAADQVLDLTGGSPFYIQRFCNELVEYMNSERAPVVTEADIERVRDSFLERLEIKDFDNLESPGYTDPNAHSSEQYQKVLLAVARASRNQAATFQAIQEEYQEANLQEFLNDLVLRDVVRRVSGGYQIVVRLYQDWLLKYFGVTSQGQTT